MTPLVNTCSFLEWHQLVGKIDYIFWVVSSPSCWYFLFSETSKFVTLWHLGQKRTQEEVIDTFYKTSRTPNSKQVTKQHMAAKRTGSLIVSLEVRYQLGHNFFYKCWFYKIASFLNKSYFLDNCVQSFEVAFQIIDLYGSFCCRKINFFQWRSIPIVN